MYDSNVSTPLGGYTVPRLTNKRQSVLEAPEGDLFDLEIVRAHLRFPNPKENDYLKDIILPTAIGAVEDYIGRALLTRKVKMTMDCVPGLGGEDSYRSGNGYFPVTFSNVGAFRWFELLGSPVSEVEAFTYFEEDGTEKTFDDTNYLVDLEDKDRLARIVLQRGALWPTALQVAKALSITYYIGYGDKDAVPPQLKHAVLLITTALFTNRGDSADSQDLVLHFPQVKALLAPFIMMNFTTI